MDFREICDRVAELATLDGLGDKFTSSSVGRHVNSMYKILLTEARAIHDVETTYVTVANSDTLSLTGREWAEVECVVINSITLERTSLERLRKMSNSWWNTAAGTPTQWWFSGYSRIKLYPTPSDAWSVAVYGYRAPSALSGTDVPDCPEYTHEPLAEGAYARLVKSIAVDDLQARSADMEARFAAAASKFRTQCIIRRSGDLGRDVQPAAIYAVRS